MNDLDFDGYQSFVDLSGASSADLRDQIAYAALKLNGEAGEVAELIGKSMRVSNSRYAVTRDTAPVEVCLELGDVLWYVAKMSRLHGFTLKDVAELNRMKLVRRREHGKDHTAEKAMATAFLGEMIDG